MIEDLEREVGMNLQIDDKHFDHFDGEQDDHHTHCQHLLDKDNLPLFRLLMQVLE